MAYTPTTWQTGDVITAEKMNKLENGLQTATTDPLFTRGTDPDSVAQVIKPIGDGETSTASGVWSAALGSGNTSSGQASLTSGTQNTASGQCSVALGTMTVASGKGSFAIGTKSSSLPNTTASGVASFAAGQSVQATGACSSAFGQGNLASGNMSSAVGNNTIAKHKSQHVFGQFNTPDESTAATSALGNYIEIVGNGNADDARSNARTLDWSGNEALAGSLTLGKGTANEVTVTAADMKALLTMTVWQGGNY